MMMLMYLARTVRDYTREYENPPMLLSVGDTVELIKRNDTLYTEWYWSRSPDGKEAWVPEAIMKIQ